MHGFLRNNSWETRVAAGQALEAIAKNVPQWAPAGAPKSGKGSNPRAAPKSGKGSDPRAAPKPGKGSDPRAAPKPGKGSDPRATPKSGKGSTVWADCNGAMDNREL